MRSVFAAGIAVATLACGGSAPAPDRQGAGAAPPPEAEAPVALNPDVPIAYPPALFEDRIEGDVVLRMFVDTTGRLLPESTRVAETSGYAALDSSALAGSARLRFAPAKRHGVPVATAFLQPVEFRYPGTRGASGTTTPPPRRPTPPPVTSSPRVLVPPVRTDTARPRLDTTRAKPPSPPPPPDTTRRDTTRAARDTSAQSR